MAAWTEQLGVRCHVGHPFHPLPPRQAALRAARYAFLHATAAEISADRIATAHHADDQAETVLFRILRGTGIRGLAGIPEMRGIIARPLLPFWREELESYLSERGIAYLTDPSNTDPRWKRVVIRTRVLPALEAAWDAPVRVRLVRLAASARRADRALLVQAKQALCGAEVRTSDRGMGFERAVLVRYHPVVQARALAHLAEKLGVRLSRGGTRAAVEFIRGGRSGASVDVGGGLELRREFGLLWLGPVSPGEARTVLRITDEAPGEGEIELGGRHFRVRWRREREAGGRGPGVPGGVVDTDRQESARGEAGEPSPPVPEVESPLELRAEEVRFPLEVRAWLPGDRIRLRGGTRKLKRLFVDRRVPLSERRSIPVVADRAGRVFWVWRVARAASDPAAEGPEGNAGPLIIDIEERQERG